MGDMAEFMQVRTQRVDRFGRFMPEFPAGAKHDGPGLLFFGLGFLFRG